MSGATFDAGGLMALDRNDRRVLALVARAAERGMRITIPATALAQAMRNPARQARLARLIRQAGTDLFALNGPDATAAGLLLARTATADVVDAHVVVCARRAGQAVVTSDAADLSSSIRLLVAGARASAPCALTICGQRADMRRSAEGSATGVNSSWPRDAHTY